MPSMTRFTSRNRAPRFGDTALGDSRPGTDRGTGRYDTLRASASSSLSFSSSSPLSHSSVEALLRSSGSFLTINRASRLVESLANFCSMLVKLLLQVGRGWEDFFWRAVVFLVGFLVVCLGLNDAHCPLVRPESTSWLVAAAWVDFDALFFCLFADLTLATCCGNVCSPRVGNGDSQEWIVFLCSNSGNPTPVEVFEPL